MRNPDKVSWFVTVAAFSIAGVFTMSTVGFAEQATTISPEEIDQLPVLDITNLADYSPSLISDLGSTNGSNRLTVRGLVPTRFQENVGVYVDGIDISSQGLASPYGSMLSNPYFFDVESVEVKKGPHSAMYGRNASAGAVLITTKDPGDEFGGKVSVGAGEFGRTLVKASLSGPVTNGLGFGLNGAYQTGDGFFDNSITDNEVGGGDIWGLGGTLKWQATESFSLRARVAYSEEELDQRAQAYVSPNASVVAPAQSLGSVVRCEPAFDTAAGSGDAFCDSPASVLAGTMPEGNDLQVRLSPNAGGDDFMGGELEVIRASLLLDWDVGPGTITSRSGYTDADTRIFNDRDKFASQASPGDGIDLSQNAQILDTDTSAEQISQELSFTSAFDGPVQFTLGGLYWNEEVDQSDQNHYATARGSLCILSPFLDACPGTTGTAVQPLLSSLHAAKPINTTERETDHWSAFGSLQWDLAEDVLVTLGLRYIDEEVTLTGPNTLVGAGQQDAWLTGPDVTDICAVGDCAEVDFSDPATYAVIATEQVTFRTTDDYWAPAASLVWSPTDSSSMYWSFSQGRTPGGLAATPLRSVGYGIDPDHNGSPNETAFNLERITSVELGGNVATMNDTLHLNVAIFMQKIANRQIVTQNLSLDFGDPADLTDDANILVDSIAGEAGIDVNGIELGIHWHPNEHWNISAEYTHLDSEYNKFTQLSTDATEIALGGCAATAWGGVATCVIDLAGNEVAGVPDNAFVGAVSYTAPLADTGMDWFIATNARYQGERFINANNSVVVGQYWISDLRLGITTDRWDVIFYADNLFDDDTVQSAYQQADTANAKIRVGACVAFCQLTLSPPFIPATAIPTLAATNYPLATIANLPDPRRWGVRASFRF